MLMRHKVLRILTSERNRQQLVDASFLRFFFLLLKINENSQLFSTIFRA